MRKSPELWDLTVFPERLDYMGGQWGAAKGLRERKTDEVCLGSSEERGGGRGRAREGRETLWRQLEGSSCLAGVG